MLYILSTSAGEKPKFYSIFNFFYPALAPSDVVDKMNAEADAQQRIFPIRLHRDHFRIPTRW